MSVASTHYHGSRFLREEDLREPSERCPVCLAAGERRFLHRLQERPDVDLVRCSSCWASSATRMPTPELLADYYGGYYEGADDMVTFANVDRFARHIFGALDPAGLSDRLRVLDYGGGDGSLGRRIAERYRMARHDGFCEITLVDVQDAPDRAEEGWSLVQTGDLAEALGRGPFDLVVASAVLEHVPDVHDVFRGLFGAVRRPGTFYARTPYVEPLLRLSKKVDVTYPAHVHDMGDRFWGRVVETFGLRDARLVASRPSPVETSFKQAPLRTAIAHALKLPARLEGALLGSRGRDMFWTVVGGWEALLRFE